MENLKDNKDIQDASREAIGEKSGIEKLHTYKQARLELASQLRIIIEGMKTLGRDNAQKQCEELMVKLAEDCFILAVLGQFKRGKSSLMNAIIGEDILPTGVLPLTSAITKLKYGPSKRLLVEREGFIFDQELPVSDLALYVTEKGNPKNEKKVKTVIVELPVPFLRTGIEFVDTPGVGSSITANTETTYGFLPECDAVLFVTSVDTPMTSLELNFLKKIKEYVNRIFFIVNKIDLASNDERKEVLDFVTETIRNELGCDSVKLFPVSSRLYLDATVSGSTTLYQESGLKALEDALAGFLTLEKTSTFLSAIIQKLLRILDNEKTEGAFEENALKARAEILKNEKVVIHRQDPFTATRLMQEALQNLLALLYNVSENRPQSTISKEVFSSAKNPGVPLPASQNSYKNDKPSTSLDKIIATDLQAASCPVCRHIANQTFDFFAHWQYQLSIEESAQDQFAAELGFCPLHTWQLLSISSPYGASVGFSKLFEQVAHQLKESIKSTKDVSIGKMIRNAHNCRICGLQRIAEKEYISKLVEMMRAPDGEKQYEQSQGVCVRHLDMLIEAVPSADTCKALISHAIQHFEQDTEDMRSFALKRDALRRGLLNKDEEEAYLRSVIRFVGNRSISTPWEDDGEID